MNSIFEQRLHSIGSTPRHSLDSRSSVSTELTRLDSTGTTMPKITSTTVTTEVYQWGGGKYFPQLLEQFTEGSGKPVICVSSGIHHFAAVTMEGEVYTWVVCSLQRLLIFPKCP